MWLIGKLPTWNTNTWEQELQDLSGDWWRNVAPYARLALTRAGIPKEAFADRLRALLMPSAIAPVCPFPNADVLRPVWDDLVRRMPSELYFPNFRDVLLKISHQVLSVPQLAQWVREGCGGCIVEFLLASQRDFLLRDIICWGRVQCAQNTALASLFDHWLSTHAFKILGRLPQKCGKSAEKSSGALSVKNEEFDDQLPDVEREVKILQFSWWAFRAFRAAELKVMNKPALRADSDAKELLRLLQVQEAAVVVAENAFKAEKAGRRRRGQLHFCPRLVHVNHHVHHHTKRRQ